MVERLYFDLRLKIKMLSLFGGAVNNSEMHSVLDDDNITSKLYLMYLSNGKNKIITFLVLN